MWEVRFADEFDAEVDCLDEAVQDALYAAAQVLEQRGPHLGRPHADTLNGSRYANMKELRFTAADGVWRVAFAFDPDRAAILLIAGDKAGVRESRFYTRLIETADARFGRHLQRRLRYGSDTS